jgi:hypothetical protein
MEDGLYAVEFENIDGLLLNCGTVTLEAGHFDGGTGGYHYAGTFSLETPNRFRAEGLISRLDSGIQKCFGVFGNESEFSVVLVGQFDGDVIKGLAGRLDKPQVTARFRLTPETPHL